MDYRTICHRAFYNPEMRGDYAGCRVSFNYYQSLERVDIYSYSTVVARIVRGLNGDKYTLISRCKYSTTTAGHISAIHSASPHIVIYVPNCETSDMVYTFRHALEAWTMEHNADINDFKHADQRRAFMDLLGDFDYYQSKIGGLDELLGLRNSRLFTTYETLCHDLNDSENISRKEAFAKSMENYQLSEDEYKAEQARLEKKRKDAARAAKRMQTIRTRKVLEQIQAFNTEHAITSALLKTILYPYTSNLKMEVEDQLEEIRRQLKQVVYDTQTGMRNASYVYIDNGEVLTSQYCRATIPTVKRLLTMWKNKQNILGENCDGYRVVGNNKDYVQVGCHVIPLWNVQMLYNELIAA